MQGSIDRSGGEPIDDTELQTANPPTRKGLEAAGREAALAYAREELDRIRTEIDEIAHALEFDRKPTPIEVTWAPIMLTFALGAGIARFLWSDR